jgi:hypothetical protein
MAVKSKTSALGEGPVFASVEVMDRFNTVVSEAADRGVAALGAGFDEWTKESQRLLDEMSAQSFAALEQLKTCKTPLEVLNVEQAWLAARSKVYMDSGMRFARTFANLAGSLTATPSAKTPEPPATAA